MTKRVPHMQLTTLSNSVVAWAALALALTATACTKTGSSFPCDEEHPCPQTYTCNEGVCDPEAGGPCENASDCASDPTGPYCVDEPGPEKACSSVCVGDQSCIEAGAGDFCVSGICGACQPAAGAPFENLESCSGNSPVCDPESLECRKCRADTECESGVCDLTVADGGLTGGTGACVAEDKLIYAKSGTVGDCSQNSKCDLTIAVNLANTPTETRNVILLEAGKYFPLTTTTITKGVALVGEQSTEPVIIDMVDQGPGAVIFIDAGTAAVAIRSLALVGGHGSGDIGNGLRCDSGQVALKNVIIKGNGSRGIYPTDACIVTVTSSTIADNSGDGIASTSSGILTVSDTNISENGNRGIATSTSGALTVSQSTFSGNQGGGIAVNGGPSNRIENSYIVDNGSVASPSYGVSIAAGRTATLEFNTIASNFRAGVFCADEMIMAKNNIVYGNAIATGSAQFSTECGTFENGPPHHNYKAIFDLTNPIKFVNSGTGAAKYRLTKGSELVRGNGTKITTVTTDYDGDIRADPPDIGADEFVD